MGKARIVLVLAVALTGQSVHADLAKRSYALHTNAPLEHATSPAASYLPDVPSFEPSFWVSPGVVIPGLWIDSRLEAGYLRARQEALQNVSTAHWVPPKLVAAVAGAAAADSRAADHEQIVELPPPPSGAALTLSGLLTLAGLQVARQARQAGLAALLNAAYVPDWYHTDAVQVGHSIPFEFQPTLQPVCSVFGLVASEADRCASRFHSPDADNRVRSDQHTLFALAPRGPPIR